MSAETVPYSSTETEKKLFKLDLGCGAVCAPGFEGVDIGQVEGVKHVLDLTKTPWPFEDNSVDEARSSHFIEHLDGEQRVAFFNELWRVLKPDAGALITTPYAWNNRAIGDPSHKWPPVCDWTYLYFSKPWRQANKLEHAFYATITCDFDTNFPHQSLSPDMVTRSAEFQAFGALHYLNSVEDLVACVIARKNR